MNKLLAITLLCIHLFNLVGYPFLFKALIARSGRQLTENIDKNKYSEKDLVEIKVALNAPYMTAWGGYERFDGEITLNGIHHNYVKRKVSGDTLYLLCLPNKKANALDAGKEEYSKKVSDEPRGKKGEDTVKKGSILNQYQEQLTEYTFQLPVENAGLHVSVYHRYSPDYFIDLHGEPPEMNS